MEDSNLTRPPSEREVSDLLAVLQQAGFAPGIDTLRRLAFQRDRLLAACKAVLAWADRECMPQGGKGDGPWEMVEAAIAKARGTSGEE